MNTNLRKKPQNDFERDLMLELEIMQEHSWKMWEDKEILSLSQQKEEETIWCQYQIIITTKFLTEIY